GGGTFGLIFSLIVTGISAFSLLLDFDFIERGAEAGAPKYMEWYGVFGLLISLVWLYVNILRLLSIFSGRD
ncbi:MAG TPA: Bax inhibitor-1/YccA family protein, partial [Prolixibacteraceae bacterium]|nr:Bax inhibitor-1/YccA family protein [Prolixibacteraceae bacterium]